MKTCRTLMLGMIFAFSFSSASVGQTLGDIFDYHGGFNFSQHGMGLDNDGNYILYGTSESYLSVGSINIQGIGPDGHYLMQLDSAFQLNWVKTGRFHSILEGFTTHTIDKYNRLWVIGKYSDSAVFEGIVFDSPDFFDAFIARYDRDGNLDFIRVLANDFEAMDMKSDSMGNIFIGGMVYDNADFGGGPLPYNGNWGGDICIVKLDSAGNYIWGEIAGGDGPGNVFDTEDAKQIDLDDNGNIYICGETVGPASFDTIHYQDSLTGFNQQYWRHGYLAKYNANAEIQWVRDCGIFPRALVADGAGNIYVGGRGDEDRRYGNQTSGTTGSNTLFIAKFNTNGDVEWVTEEPVSYSNSSDCYEMKLGVDGTLYAVGDIADTSFVSGFVWPGACGTGTANIMAIDTSNGNLIWVEGTCNPYSNLRNITVNGCQLFTGGTYDIIPSWDTFPFIDTTHYFPSSSSGAVLITFELDSCHINPPAVLHDTIWPGDVNADGIANNDDMLYLGLANGQTGPTRPGANISWTGQACPSWPTGFSAIGVNHNNADCNGDGSVNSADTSAIIQNYGLTHQKTSDNERRGGAPPLCLELASTSVAPGGTAVFNIKLGSAAIPAADFHGVSFSILYDDQLLDGSSITYEPQNSWLGQTNIDLLSLQKNLSPNNRIDLATTRTDQVNESGQGTIGQLSARLLDYGINKDSTVTLNKSLAFSFVDVTGIDANGNLLLVDPCADTFLVSKDTIISIDTTTSIGLINSTLQQFELYPNPAMGSVTLMVKPEVILGNQIHFELYNLLGKQLMREPIVQATSKWVLNFAKGVYIYNVTINGIRHSGRLILLE